MQAPDRQQRLCALRDIIADIERKPALADARQSVIEADRERFPDLAAGLFQEVFTDSARNGGASFGFALEQSKTLLTPRRPVIVYLQLVSDSQFFGLPYGPGLFGRDFDPSCLIMVRPRTMAEMLWVAEEALSCRAVAGIVADIGGAPKLLDFTASRRLALRAAENGTSLFLLRYGTAREASAAHLRWHLAPLRSGRQEFDPGAPGSARWRLTLERGTTMKRPGAWFLEWTKNGFATFPAGPHGAPRRTPQPALPGAVPAALANGLSQTA
jgi:protein ImuA